MPRQLVQVRAAITKTATSWPEESEMAYPPERWTGGMRYCCSEIAGQSTPVNRAKATATAAMVPVWMTVNSVQPYRKPRMGENASPRYTYMPPAFGIIAASSPYDTAAARVNSAVTS